MPGLADGQGIATGFVLLYCTGWNSSVNSSLNNFADTKVGEKEGRGGAPSAGAEIPLQPMVDHGEAGCPSAAYGG